TPLHIHDLRSVFRNDRWSSSSRCVLNPSNHANQRKPKRVRQNMAKAMLEKWSTAANAVETPMQRLAAPFPVITDDAIDIARFCETHWEPQVDGKGREVVPGLASAVRPGLFEPSIGQEILELQEATQAANTAYLMTSQRGTAAPMERALFVLGELRAVLTFLTDDDEDDIDDERLGNLAAMYDSAASQDAVASALDDYAGVADYHREAVDGLG